MLLLALAGCPMGMDDMILIDDFVGETADIPRVACLPETAKAPIATWYPRLREAMVTGGAGADASHALATYELPGVSAGSWFYLEHTACAGARTDPPVCAGSVCWTASCPGSTAAWEIVSANAPDDGGTSTRFGTAVVTGGTIGLSWSPSTGRVSAAVHADALAAAADGLDFALDGTATVTDGRFEATFTFPVLDAQGPVVLSGADDAASLFIGGLPVADWDGTTFADTSCSPG